VPGSRTAFLLLRGLMKRGEGGGFCIAEKYSILPAMKYELETIPVWEAYRADGECPVCVLEKKNEAQYLKFFLGDSVMDPDTRVEANRKGFCVRHSNLLLEGGHKLGLALMSHTFLQQFLAKYRDMKKEEKVARARKKTPPDWPGFIRRSLSECLFCERLAQTLDRYVYTIVYLYRKDEDFRTTFQGSKGFCLPHAARVLEMADGELKGPVRDGFFSDLLTIEEQRLAVLEGEIDWFTQKFDYRNQDKPWGNSADALPRVLQKLKGHLFIDRK
jgi:hypothetical protein